MGGGIGRSGFSNVRIAALARAAQNSVDVAQAIGVDGFPLIVFGTKPPTSRPELASVHCGDVVCAAPGGAGAVLHLGTATDVAIAIGADGLGLVAYVNGARHLATEHCANVACLGSDATAVIDAVGIVPVTGGHHVSVALGADGLPVISYIADASGDLQVAHCNNAKCTTSSTVRPVDAVGGGAAGTDTALVIGSDGLPFVAVGGQFGGVQVVHCTRATCAFAVISGITGGDSVGVAVGADNRPLISYRQTQAGASTLGAAHCNDAACMTATPVNIDGALPAVPPEDLGQYSWVTMGADGRALITYLDATTGALKAAHCADSACTTAATNVVLAGIGAHSSVVTGVDGLPFMVGLEWNATTGATIRGVHSSNLFGVPYTRNR